MNKPASDGAPEFLNNSAINSATRPTVSEHSTIAANQWHQGHIQALETQILTLAANINAAKYQWLTLLAEFDRLEGWCECEAVGSTANWLSFKCGITPGAARENVRVARALTELPLISAAFKAGELSYSKVRAMTRAATPENEDYLIMVARHGTGAHMERLVRLRARTMKLSDPQASRRAWQSRSLEWRYDDDGTVVISARLMPEQAEAVIGVIQSLSQQIHDESAAEAEFVDQPVENEDTLESLRLEKNVAERRTQQRVDALERLAQLWLNRNSQASASDKASPEKSFIGARDGTEHTMMVHVEATALSALGSDGSENSQLGVSAETLPRIGCDTALIASIDDSNGKPLNIGTRRRTISAALRRALQARDSGCTFPGCSHTQFVDAHHIEHWCHGGETRLDNLILLCRRHHRLLHEGGFTVTMTDGQPPEFYSPKSIPVHARKIVSFSPENIAAINHRCGVHVDATTVATLWDGVHPDWSTMVEATLPQRN